MNKFENRKIKTGQNLKLLAHETMKLFGSKERNTNKDKNGENVLHLEILKQQFILMLLIITIDKI